VVQDTTWQEGYIQDSEPKYLFNRFILEITDFP
jgi:hypothetical protein